MKKFIQETVNFLLKPLDLALHERDLQWERDVLFSLYESRRTWTNEKIKSKVECIMFSKDRVLQLHALLSSYFEKINFPPKVYILYQTSSAAHQNAYEDLKSLFSDRDAEFIKQSSDQSFREDVIRLLKSLRSEKVFFLVDDIIFTEDTDIADFAKISTDEFIPTLRMGMNLMECFPLQKQQPQPQFIQHQLTEPDKIAWQWDQGIYDWGYPLSLDGHLFSAREITIITEFIDFRAPNSYESNLQRFNWLFQHRLGIGYRKSKTVNVACNRVQTENDNICGNIHQDYLLDQWTKGFQMDYRKLYGFVNKGAHQDIPFNMVKRNR